VIRFGFGEEGRDIRRRSEGFYGTRGRLLSAGEGCHEGENESGGKSAHESLLSIPQVAE
jgi:hypothetical protein